MALTDDNNMVMPVAPMYGGGMNNGFGNGFGGDGWWILLLFILLGNGAWGNGFGGWGGGGAGALAADGAMLYPWMNQAEITSDGFRDQMLNNNITSIRDGIGDITTQLCNGFGGVQQSLCNGFAGVNATVNSGFANAETAANSRHMATTQQAYSNQIANMQQAFANQQAMSTGFNQLGSQFADCCCENRLGLADLKYTVATENCADRTAAAQNTRDIIDSQTRGTQAILDKLCALELDGVKGQLAQAQRENVGLQNQLNMATMAASQAAQTATFQQGLNNEVDALYNRLKNCPVGTVPVFGNQPIFTCPTNVGNNGCGCGCGSI